MKALILKKIGDLQGREEPLEPVEWPLPIPKKNEMRLKIIACGVCHTELDEIEGRTPPAYLPMILGHQVVGRVESAGPGVSRVKEGDRVGVAWIYSACGQCRFCREGRENLCYGFKATGREAPGGYAEYMTVSEDFVHPLPAAFTDTEAAPLLCAGAIGYRSLALSGLKDGQNLGLAGFGASAHLVLMLAKYLYPKLKAYVFARSESEREFARQLGAAWAGEHREESPEKLDAVIDTTPVWQPVIEALKNLERGGRLVINAIRKESVDRRELAKLDYARNLWLEKEIKSVANVTRRDVREFLELAAQIPLKPQVQEYPLEEANRALRELKAGKIRGAKVLRIA